MNRKSSILGIVIAVSILFLSSGMVSAIDYEYSYDDETGDVDDPAIDITHIETAAEGDNVKFQIEVDGEIKESTNSTEYSYFIRVLNTSSIRDFEKSTLIDYDGAGNASYVADNNEFHMIDATVEGNTLTIEVPKSAFSHLDEFHLAPIANKEVKQTDKGSRDTAYSWRAASDDGDGDNGDTPGFEVVTMLAAMSITVGIYGYTRKNKM